MQFVFGFLIGLGVFFILEDRLRIPYLSASAAYVSLVRRQERKISALDVYMSDFAAWMAGKIRLNEYSRIRIRTDLLSAGIDKTPEQHVADSIVRAIPAALAAIPVWFISPILTSAVLCLAVWIGLRAFGGTAERIRVKRERIEAELPRFVSHIEKTLTHSRDVLTMISDYRETAGPEFASELAVTEADMRSGHPESALTRLSSRVGSRMLTDTVSGLISAVGGSDTTVYWQNLELAFAGHQRELLKAQAMKVPSRVRWLSFCLLCCFMAMYAVVIILQIVDALGGMFG